VNFLSVPRVVFGLARSDLAPRSLVLVSGVGTPVGGLLLITALVFLLAMTRSFEYLIQFMMFVAISVDTMILIALFRLRALYPQEQRPYRVPGYPWLPVVVVILYSMILVLVTATQPKLAVGAGALLAALLIAGLIWSRIGAAPDRRASSQGEG
jgi:APA family basic amino acid/polyamine antiporter